MESAIRDELNKYSLPAVWTYNRSDGPIGYSVEQAEYDTEAISNFCCPACFLIPKVPISFGRCGHIMCDFCWMRYCQARYDNMSDLLRNRALTCGICRMEHSPHQIKHYGEWDPLLNRVYGSVRVACTNTGCKIKNALRDMEQHEVFQCKKRLVTCPNGDCNVQLVADLMPAHVIKCTKLTVYHNCGLAVPLAEYTRHDCLRALTYWVRLTYQSVRSKDMQSLAGLQFGDKGKPNFREQTINLEGLHRPVQLFLHSLRSIYNQQIKQAITIRQRPASLTPLLPTPLASPIASLQVHENINGNAF